MLTQSSDNKPHRDWREVAEELTQEEDSARLAALSEELMDALDEDQARKENFRATLIYDPNKPR